MDHDGMLRNRYLIPGSDRLLLASRRRFAQQSENHGHVRQVARDSKQLDLVLLLLCGLRCPFTFVEMVCVSCLPPCSHDAKMLTGTSNAIKPAWHTWALWTLAAKGSGMAYDTSPFGVSGVPDSHENDTPMARIPRKAHHVDVSSLPACTT